VPVFYLPVGRIFLDSFPLEIYRLAISQQIPLRGNFLSKVQTVRKTEPSVKLRLLEAGTALFAEKGYASTSVREIVAQAGVTKPVLYYYFQNKEGLFRAILDWAAELQQALLDEVLETPGTVFDRLVELYTRIYKGVVEYQHLFKLIHGLMFGPPQGVPDYDFRQYHQRMARAVKAIYGEGLKHGEVKEADPEEVAILVMGLIDFSFHLHLLEPRSMAPARLESLLRLTFE
jgi:AcrR family transcriptional regulator